MKLKRFVIEHVSHHSIHTHAHVSFFDSGLRAVDIFNIFNNILNFDFLPHFVKGVEAAETELEIVGTTSAMCKFAQKKGIDLRPLLE
jgi:hypothetical protein